MGISIGRSHRGLRRRLGAMFATGVLALVVACPVQAAAPIGRHAGLPVRDGVQTDTAKMVGYDVGGGAYGFGTIRLTTWYNSERFTKETLKFAMHDLEPSARYLAEIFQGTCEDMDHHYRIRVAVRATSAGRLASTVSLSATQRALMLKFNGEYPAVSIELVPVEPSTGMSYPCGELWGEGFSE
jgi:hypothetical protein